MIKNKRTNIEKWKELVNKKAQQIEENRKIVIKQLYDALDVLSNQYIWQEIYIFGSLIEKDRFRLNSDVDIAVKGLNKFLHFQFTAQLSTLLERDVDVVILEDNCIFKQEIINKGIKWKKKL